MESLPLIPGYTFQNPQIQEYKVGHRCDFSNGYRVMRDSQIGIGGRPIDAASGKYIKDIDHDRYDPALTYGPKKSSLHQSFVPHYVLYADKCLSFQGFFRQAVPNSPDANFTIRQVKITYFLEDDTISVRASGDCPGFPQKKLVTRGKVEKNQNGDHYSWKDLNIGIDVCIYGIVYRITNCDSFTREYLTSQGIDVNDAEEQPLDPHSVSRKMANKVPAKTTTVIDDSRRRFLEFDRMILSFDASSGEDLYQIRYFLTDDTIAIREIRKPNDGKDPVSMLLKKTKVPKDWKNLPSNYPAIYMERGDSEVVEYYAPKDLLIGETISVFGRNFLLHDCDTFTRKYYSEMLGIEQSKKVPLPEKRQFPRSKYVPPPHTGFGSPEDSYASCLSFKPKRPKKNVIRQLVNASKKMRYSMQMDAVHPEDKDRDFILEYHLSDGTITIIEVPKRNSGRMEGCFLASMLVPKPGSVREDPNYYTAQDFFIGATINVFNHYFKITGADLFVYRYIEANTDKFPQELHQNIRNYFLKEGLLKDDVNAEVEKLKEQEESKLDLDPTIGEPCIGERQGRRGSACKHVKDRPKSSGSPRETSPQLPMKERTADATKPCSSGELVKKSDSLEKFEQVIKRYPRRELKWADQTKQRSADQPTVSSSLTHSKFQNIKRDCKVPDYFSYRDQRPEVKQLLYENAIQSPKQ